jgi:hypothetical protein
MKYSIVILILLILVAGCAPVTTTPAPSTTQPAITSPVEPSTPPVTYPSAPPTPSPAPTISTTPVIENPTSFESITYDNDQYGFAVKYPKSWANDTLIGDMVMRVAAQAGDLQSDAVAVAVVNKPSDYGKAIKEAVDATLAASNVNVKTKLESIVPTTLSDGKTAAKEAVLSADVFGMYTLYVYALATDKGEKTIAVTGLTIKGDSNKALIKEIAQTLSVK